MAEKSSNMGETTDEASRSSSSSVIGKGNLPSANNVSGLLIITERLDSSAGRLNLERSINERRKQILLQAWQVQLYDANVSVKKKRKMLNRMASVKDDGFVIVGVPSNVGPASLETRSKEPVDSMDTQCIPSLQIVILIVGTRGDVLPFVAIGKSLTGLVML